MIGMACFGCYGKVMRVWRRGRSMGFGGQSGELGRAGVMDKWWCFPERATRGSGREPPALLPVHLPSYARGGGCKG